MAGRGIGRLVRTAAILALALCCMLVWLRRPPAIAPEPTRAPSAGEGFVATSAADGPAPERQVDPTARTDERVALSETPEAVQLTLLRWPDSRPLAHRSIELRSDGDERIAETDAQGRLELVRPRGAEPVRVEAVGFEVGSIAPEALHGVNSFELELRPRSGLFGRVVERDGSPVDGASVAAFRDEIEVWTYETDSGAPVVRARMTSDGLSRAQTDALGWYWLDVDTRLESTPIQLTALDQRGRTAERILELPRAPEPVEDLVLEVVIAPEVEVSVVDLAGRPIPGVQFWPRLSRTSYPPEGFVTGADGTCRVLAPEFPFDVFPHSASWTPVQKRIDGVDVPTDTQIERADQRLEWVCTPLENVSVRVLDSRTDQPLPQAGVRLRVFLGSDEVAGLHLVASAQDATQSFGFWPWNGGREPLVPAPDYDRVLLGVEHEGYESIRNLELARDDLPPGGVYVVRLDPDPTLRELTGRLVDAEGRGVAGVQVTAIDVTGEPDPRRAGAFSGDDGSFRIRWKTAPTCRDVLLVAFDWRQRRLGVAGPLAEIAVTDSELVLEPALEVPYLLESDAPDELLVLSVSYMAGGRPVFGHGWATRTYRADDGARRGALLVSRRYVSIVGLGVHLGSRSEMTPGCERTVDPSALSLPLRLSLPASVVSARGRVRLPAHVEPDGLHVVAVSLDASGATRSGERTCALGSDGSFRLEALPAGWWLLVVVRLNERGTNEVLASVTLELAADRDDVVLVASEE